MTKLIIVGQAFIDYLCENYSSNSKSKYMDMDSLNDFLEKEEIIYSDIVCNQHINRTE